MTTFIRFGVVKICSVLFKTRLGKELTITTFTVITFGGMTLSLMLFNYNHAVAGVGTLITCEIAFFPVQLVDIQLVSFQSEFTDEIFNTYITRILGLTGFKCLSRLHDIGTSFFMSFDTLLPGYDSFTDITFM